MKFIEITANKNSLAQRKLVHGIGINDALYIVRPLIDGKHIFCPFYKVWSCMIQRCYSTKHLQRCPTYTDCTVDNDWLVFSVFRSWMEKQDWKGKQLDKDILIQGNKVYTSNACIFVTKEINLLLVDSRAARGKHPQGVHYNVRQGKYTSRCKVDGKYKCLGSYNEMDDARSAYNTAKYAYIAKIANQQTEPLRSALLAYKIK